MADILVYSRDTEQLLEIERIVREQSMRAKVTSEKASVDSWIEMRSFTLAILDCSVGMSEVQELLEALWQSNTHCRVLVVGAEESQLLESLILGAEIVTREGLREHLKSALKDICQLENAEVSLEHILVVEDLDSPRDILCMFLEGLGYTRITGVRSGEEALQHLSATPTNYTAVLTDIRMPNMSGNELIREIRRTPGLDRIPVVVLTAYGTADCLIDCLRAGATGFLVKPPKKPDLKRELDRAHRVRRTGSPVRLVPEDKVDALYALLEERGLV